MSIERPEGTRPVEDAVDQAWRTASHEEPGPRLDTVILAAARAEAERARELTAAAAKPARQSPPRRRDWWTSWQPLAAAAAVAGLAFVLVQTIPRDQDVAAPIPVERTHPEAAASEAHDAAPAPPSVESGRVMEPQRQFTATPPPSEATKASPPAETPSAAAVATPENTDSSVAASAEAIAEAPLRSRPSVPAPAVTPAPAGIATQAERELGAPQRATASAAGALAPEAWAARIGELIDAGDRAAAADELRAFRAAHADADRYLPEDLRNWAAAVE